ncbi:acetyl-CoA carboxylase biotin carboxyl carrier protein subunit [Aequorivita sp. H23M31]|uniref:Acetyl-CoA carboxylase biotin carboxyl carrier protein subunit n=1 Tax=Aequorivita ciconiae TaxID=2494375 RepID=A0A410G263_9FLAO|nr:acetyl-CoA carboxylase biotin carboxyl carrier protein subunit [Aequorivita sp. H23M31]QAA81329.1 acetyl-CoA carboxylase biotin carboxyl carrier protein subunit [Aequorivita sp. H23M31]
MKDHYRLSVDENYQFDLEIDEATNLNQLDFSEPGIGGKKERIHILHQNKSYSAEILHVDFIQRKYTIKINGNTYKVGIETPLAQLIKKMGLSLGTTSVDDDILAPMPGIILEVNVQEGNEVKEGDLLCVLEAMKMENALSAPRDGTIKFVNITKGDTVDKGKLLIEFQKND